MILIKSRKYPRAIIDYPLCDECNTNRQSNVSFVLCTHCLRARKHFETKQLEEVQSSIEYRLRDAIYNALLWIANIFNPKKSERYML